MLQPPPIDDFSRELFPLISSRFGQRVNSEPSETFLKAASDAVVVLLFFSCSCSWSFYAGEDMSRPDCRYACHGLEEIGQPRETWSSKRRSKMSRIRTDKSMGRKCHAFKNSINIRIEIEIGKM
jgi:hypothetical protein